VKAFKMELRMQDGRGGAQVQAQKGTKVLLVKIRGRLKKKEHELNVEHPLSKSATIQASTS